jgi:hypothetical protein
MRLKSIYTYGDRSIGEKCMNAVNGSRVSFCFLLKDDGAWERRRASDGNQRSKRRKIKTRFVSRIDVVVLLLKEYLFFALPCWEFDFTLPFSHEIFRERVFFDGMERVY